jgi:hypothetical protein
VPKRVRSGSSAGAAQQPEPKPQGVSGMPCIAATAASPGRGAQPDAGVDAALGSAFNTSGRSNDDVCGSPSADRGPMGDGGDSGGGSSTPGLNRTQSRRTVESAEVLDSFGVRIESLEERVLNLENPSRKTLSNLMGKLQQLDVEMDQAASVRGLSGEQWLLPRRKALLARIETLTQQVDRAIQADASGRLGLEQEQRDIHMAVGSKGQPAATLLMSSVGLVRTASMAERQRRLAAEEDAQRSAAQEAHDDAELVRVMSEQDDYSALRRLNSFANVLHQEPQVCARRQPALVH